MVQSLLPRLNSATPRLPGQPGDRHFIRPCICMTKIYIDIAGTAKHDRAAGNIHGCSGARECKGRICQIPISDLAERRGACSVAMQHRVCCTCRSRLDRSGCIAIKNPIRSQGSRARAAMCYADDAGCTGGIDRTDNVSSCSGCDGGVWIGSRSRRRQCPLAARPSHSMHRN